jgi:hypothetical protein
MPLPSAALHLLADALGRVTELTDSLYRALPRYAEFRVQYSTS